MLKCLFQSYTALPPAPSVMLLCDKYTNIIIQISVHSNPDRRCLRCFLIKGCNLSLDQEVLALQYELKGIFSTAYMLLQGSTGHVR